MNRIASVPKRCHVLTFVALMLTFTAAGIGLAGDGPFSLHGIAPGSLTDTYQDAPDSPQASRGWPAAIGENFSSPVFHDLDGDGIMEVIAADRQRTYVLNAQVELLPGWPRNTGDVVNTPAIADIDGDGLAEIIVASGAPPRIRCMRLDGTSLPGFPVNLPYQNWLNVTAPAVADVDGDGYLDVGAQSESGVAFFDRFGQPLPGWPYLWTTQQNIAWSAPAVADLDNDGHLEVVVGNNNLYGCSVHVIRHDGTAMPGWPRETTNIFASAAVGDLDGDGDLEIVIQEGDPTWYGNQMHVWHHDGSYVTGWPRAIAPQWESSRSNPALADVNGDGNVEIVTATGDAKLHVIRPDGTELSGYPRTLPASGPISSVQVIDVDADGVQEFFLAYHSGGSQWVGGWKLDGTALPGFPKLLFQSSQLNAHSSCHIADIDGDGVLELCAQGGTFGNGLVQVYTVDGSVYNPATSRSDWPKIRRDLHNTGHYAPADLTSIEGVEGVEGREEECSRPARIGCFPNPIHAGGVLRLRMSGTGLEGFVVFDALGRRVGGAVPRLRPVVSGNSGAETSAEASQQASAEVYAEFSLAELFHRGAVPGVYLLRPIGGGAATRLVVTGR